MHAREPQRRGSTLTALAALLGAFLITAAAAAQEALPGDVNRDGEINILDVQGSINIALGSGAVVPEADVDANAGVDVRDVQAIINTALGIGGLVQPVEGVVDLLTEGPVPAAVVAVSADGRIARATINSETGAFRLLLDVGATWSMGFMNSEGSALAALRFPAQQYPSATLPLLQLATGAILDLGLLPANGEILAGFDIRTFLGASGEPLDLGDYDGNGPPDIIDALLFPLPATLPVSGLELPDELSQVSLINDLVTRINEVWSAPIPTLVGAEIDGVPDFVVPLLDSIDDALHAWLSEDGLGIPGFIVDLYVDYVMDALRAELNSWLEDLDRIDLHDANGNYIPDYLEQALCVPGFFGPCSVDANNNSVADFLEDLDQDGVCNLYDPDFVTEDDLDGDGIANAADIDDDGDGIPDYADAEPTDPNVA